MYLLSFLLSDFLVDLNLSVYILWSSSLRPSMRKLPAPVSVSGCLSDTAASVPRTVTLIELRCLSHSQIVLPFGRRHLVYNTINWATSWENLSSKFATRQARLKPACSTTETSWTLESLDLARIYFILSKQRTTKVLIRLRGCTFVVCTWHKQVFSWCGSINTRHGSQKFQPSNFHSILLQCRNFC